MVPVDICSVLWYHIKNDWRNTMAVYLKLYNKLENSIKTGRLLPGDKLPSKRAFAKAEGVSLNTVMAVYDLAAKNGLIHSVERVGYFVAGDYKHEYTGNPWSSPEKRKYVFSINSSGIKSFTKKFTKSRHNAEYDIEHRLLLSKEYTGNSLLRERICEYLYKTRHIRCKSEQIILASGLSEIMSICSRLIGSSAVYAFEDPTEKKLVFALTDSRKIAAVPADVTGFDINALYNSGADVFFCMPEKQYPIGYKMSAEKRAELLNWCGRDKYIIEYGLCCDFSFTEPIAPLYNSDENGCVIYINSFDKITAPGISLSYMVLPENLVSVFKDKLWYHHSNVSEYDCLVLSEFIAGGGIYSNIKMQKKIYEKKKNIALEEFNALPFAEHLSFIGTDNGYFFGIDVDTDKKGYELMASNSQHDIKLLPVSCYNYVHNNSATVFAFGYASMPDSDLRDGIRLIGKAWSDML